MIKMLKNAQKLSKITKMIGNYKNQGDKNQVQDKTQGNKTKEADKILKWYKNKKWDNNQEDKKKSRNLLGQKKSLNL